MNPPGGTANQEFGDNNDVDLLIGVSHGDVYFNASKTPTPAELLDLGKHNLNSGIVDRAQTRIDEAIEGDLRGGEVCFYFVLALLSGRSLEQLSEHERQRLKSAESDLLHNGSPGPADPAARLVLDLVDLDAGDRDDVDALFDRLDEIGEQWRRPIVRHLEFVVEGRAKDALWQRSVKQARADQMNKARVDRAWKFFHPDPIGPVKAPVREFRPDALSVVGLVASSLMTVAFLIQLVTDVISFLWFAVALFAVGTCVFLIGDRSAHRRVSVRASVLRPPLEAPPIHLSGPLGMYCKRFAKEDLLDPKGVMDATKSIRDAVAWELSSTYPDYGRMHTGPIRWLIRYRARQIVGIARSGNPAGLCPELDAVPMTALGIPVSGLVAVATGLTLLVGALNADAWSTVQVLPLIALFGYLTVRLGLRIAGNEREIHYLLKRSQEQYRLDFERFEEWRDRLRDRPKEDEMAEWLSADRVLLIDRALTHYKLEPRQVLSHAILESPDKGKQAHSRARVSGGPWRHQHYSLTMFLLSGDGIRQVMTKLEFATGQLSNDARENFRYDTICSFRVETTPGNGRILKLRRMDGNSDEYAIVAADETPDVTDDVAEISAEAAGLHQTIHLLEGIAAEGRTWLSAG
ncbi:hypothetical protein [Kineosporia sp. NBRC 101731]|uniref:hypothetical protein n=1 Tax=Kineosporia sp. NBRC 101731 TaxID=3032199 RepID=UPI0024A15583|nr:hypothetical protein [Kineosporia sp. NBRC 101731]GLY28907.1 hypothetical protein Kisp02_22720 [Kineosporia sp. NBRC 101731]